MEQKRCTQCGIVKNLSEFHKRNASVDGLQPQCKLCCAVYKKQYRAANPAYNNLWREAHPEQEAASKKRWREVNHERVLATDKLYRETHREERAANQRRWRAENHEQHVDNKRRRRARKAAATIESFDAHAVWDYWGPMCAYCGSTENLTIDHIIPLASGGAHSPDNLCIACKGCNSSKGAKKLIEWLHWKVQTAELAVNR